MKIYLDKYFRVISSDLLNFQFHSLIDFDCLSGLENFK